MIHQRGSALLSALFIMTLVAIATTTLVLQVRHHIAETQLIISSEKKRALAQAVRFSAMHALTDEKNKDFGYTSDAPPIHLHNVSIDGIPNAQFSLEIIDLNARFNLNDLYKPALKNAFFRLARHVLEDKSGKTAFGMASSIAKWVSDYRLGPSQHQTEFIAHTPMASLSELDFVKEITPKAREQLLPYITVLPRDTPININTTSDDILMAFVQGDKAAQALEKLLSLRGSNPIESIESVGELLKEMAIDPSFVTVESEYFLSIGQVNMGKQEITLYSLLKRVKNKEEDKAVVYLIHETWHAD